MKIILTEEQVNNLTNQLLKEGWAFNEATYEKLKDHIYDLYLDMKDLAKRHGNFVSIKLGQPVGSVLSINIKTEPKMSEEENQNAKDAVHNEAKKLVGEWGKRKLEGGKFEVGPFLKSPQGGEYADIYWLDEKTSKKVGLDKGQTNNLIASK